MRVHVNTRPSICKQLQYTKCALCTSNLARMRRQWLGLGAVSQAVPESAAVRRGAHDDPFECPESTNNIKTLEVPEDAM